MTNEEVHQLPGMTGSDVELVHTAAGPSDLPERPVARSRSGRLMMDMSRRANDELRDEPIVIDCRYPTFSMRSGDGKVPFVALDGDVRMEVVFGPERVLIATETLNVRVYADGTMKMDGPEGILGSVSEDGNIFVRNANGTIVLLNADGSMSIQQASAPSPI